MDDAYPRRCLGHACDAPLALKSLAIPQPPQVGLDGLLQCRGLGELGVQFGYEARHLFLEGFAVVLDFLSADIAAGREDVAVRGDFCSGGGFAEAGEVGVFARAFVSAPGVVGGDDFLEVGVGQLAVDAVDEGAEFAGVDEEGVFAAVASFAVVFVFRQEPQADRNLRAVEELAGQGDHAVHEVGFDEGFANLTFAGLVGGHAAIGEDEAGHAVRREVVDEVLHPGEVGVALGRDAELPAHVVVFAEPVGVVELRASEDVVGAEVGMEVAAEGVGVLGADVGFDAAHGEVHQGEAARGGRRILAEEREVVNVAAVETTKFCRHHETRAGGKAGIVNAAVFCRREHFHDEAVNARRRVELPAVLALGAGEAGQEILIHPPKQICVAPFGRDSFRRSSKVSASRRSVSALIRARSRIRIGIQLGFRATTENASSAKFSHRFRIETCGGHWYFKSATIYAVKNSDYFAIGPNFISQAQHIGIGVFAE